MSLLHSTILIGKPAEFIRLSLLRSIEMLQAEFPISTVPSCRMCQYLLKFVTLTFFSKSSCVKDWKNFKMPKIFSLHLFWKKTFTKQIFLYNNYFQKFREIEYTYKCSTVGLKCERSAISQNRGKCCNKNCVLSTAWLSSSKAQIDVFWIFFKVSGPQGAYKEGFFFKKVDF